MRRPANQEKLLERIAAWRAMCPELALRSAFIVGFPGETEEDFSLLLDWLAEARLERVGCFKYEAVAGAKANDLADHVPEEVKEERWHRFMQIQQEISASILKAKVGRQTEVLVDRIDSKRKQAVARGPWDAPEIDGNVFLPAGRLDPGDMVRVRITRASEYDLHGQRLTLSS
jgi:ribosomal protein S12 methylthiotransferase